MYKEAACACSHFLGKGGGYIGGVVSEDFPGKGVVL